jgi:hypothetical protein
MHIRYIGHAGLALDVAGQHLLCDPWWNGPAYTGQWQAYPLPRFEKADLESADFIYISHGHEDHLHIPTLRSIDKRAALLIPKHRDPGLRDSLQSMGFARVIEIGHGQQMRLAPGLLATIYLNKEDSILVLQGDGRTLVNANDALHASPRHIVDHLCRQIRARHPRIDTLLLGYSGASWFPNCIQITDDQGYDATERERIFTQSFAYVTRQLEPRTVLPIGSGWVLLEERLRWINDVRFRSPSPAEELHRQGAHQIACHPLQPGDRLLDDLFMPASGGRPTAEEVEADLHRLFPAGLAEMRLRLEPDEERLEKVRQALHANASQRGRRLLRDGQRLLCRIDLRDVPGVSFLVDCERRNVHVQRCDRLRLAPLVLTTRLAVLEALATQTYGYESISIGYGATLQLRRGDLEMRTTLLGLLGRKPLPPTRMEALVMWLRSPWRSFDTRRRDLHWEHLAVRLRKGEIQRTNDIFSADPETWSPLRSEPIERHTA